MSNQMRLTLSRRQWKGLAAMARRGASTSYLKGSTQEAALIAAAKIEAALAAREKETLT